MTHWGWYWKVKKQHSAKALCSQLECLDSYALFKNKGFAGFTIQGQGYEARGALHGSTLEITTSKARYSIPIERLPCHFGGARYFFHCPVCSLRMRKLYGMHGMYVCRKCLNLGYYTQRQMSSVRNAMRKRKIENALEQAGGSIYQKPKWMKWCTYNRLRMQYEGYCRKQDAAMLRECREIFGL